MPFITVDGQQLYHKWYRPDAGNGVTLALVHGLGSSHSFYATIIPSLISHRFACLAIDTPGSGLSPHGGLDRSPSDIAKLINGILQQLSIDPQGVVAVGHSMGAMVACELGLLASLRGVVLVGPVHPTPALGDIFAQRIKNVEENGLEVLADTIPTAATGSKSKPLHHAFIRSLILSQTAEGYNSLCRTIANASPPKYDQLRCPLLIIAGSDDKTSPLAGCETILQSWGGKASESKIEVLQGVGHWHCVEAPEEVARLVETFALGANGLQNLH